MDITFRLHWHNLRYFDDVIISSRREIQMGDQVIFISYPLKLFPASIASVDLQYPSVYILSFICFFCLLYASKIYY